MYIWVCVCVCAWEYFSDENILSLSLSLIQARIQVEWKKAIKFFGKKRRKKISVRKATFNDNDDDQGKEEEENIHQDEDNSKHFIHNIFYVLYYLKRMTAQTSSVDGFWFLGAVFFSHLSSLVLFRSFWNAHRIAQNGIKHRYKLVLQQQPKWMWQDDFCIYILM